MDDPAAELERLLKDAQAGDEDAMAQLIVMHRSLIYTLAYRLTGDADQSLDLAQETFIRATARIRDVSGPDRLRPWLCTIVKNLTYDYLRKRARQRTVPLDAVEERLGVDPVGPTRRGIVIQRALMRLGERDRTILTLYYLNGLNLAEVSAALGVSTDAAKVSLFRARTRLREQLKGYEDELLS